MDINENENEDEDILKVFPEERNFKNSNLKKKKQVKNKIFDNFLNFTLKSNLRVII